MLFFLLNYEQLSIYFFLPFRLLHFSSLITSDFFYFPKNFLFKKQIIWFELISLN